MKKLYIILFAILCILVFVAGYIVGAGEEKGDIPMEEITLEQFKEETERFVMSALSTGDIFAINTGTGGKAVLMEEAEYNVMRQALIALLG